MSHTLDDNIDICPHCGSVKEPWFSRTVPMGYICVDCGNDVNVETLDDMQYEVHKINNLVLVRSHLR